MVNDGSWENQIWMQENAVRRARLDPGKLHQVGKGIDTLCWTTGIKYRSEELLLI